MAERDELATLQSVRTQSGATEAGVLIERGVGEALKVTPTEQKSGSALRPQQSRSGVWRWHVRRRRRAN